MTSLLACSSLFALITYVCRNLPNLIRGKWLLVQGRTNVLARHTLLRFCTTTCARLSSSIVLGNDAHTLTQFNMNL